MGIIYINPFAFSGIVTNGLILHLDAGNSASYPGSGTTWTDLSGNGNNGTLVNGVGYNAANGGSLVFDGVNDYCNVSETANMTPQILTVECIFKVTSDVNTGVFGNPAFQYLIFRQNTRTSSFEAYTIGYSETSRSISATATPSGGFQYSIGSPNNTVLLNLVYFVSVVFDATTMFLYLNGSLVATAPKASGINYRSDHTLKIGRTVPVGTSWDAAFNGSIYSVKIYNRVLTLQEIQQNFNATRGRFGI